MQEANGPLRMRRRLKDRPPVVTQNLEPGAEVRGVIGAGLEFGSNAEVGAQKAAAEFGNQFLSRPLGSVLGIAAEVAAETMRRRRPVRVMPISA